MKTRHIRTIVVSTDLSSFPISDARILSSTAMSVDGHEPSGAGEATISDVVFKGLIKSALDRHEKTPLNKTVTSLLGLSTDVDVIFTKQIGISTGENLHGLIVSIQPNSDDIILVNRTSTIMDMYLTDSCRQLRAAATLQRESNQLKRVSNEQAAEGYVHELKIWALVGEIARL